MNYGRVITYFIYTKPKVWGLLVFVAAISAFLALNETRSGSISLLILSIGAVALGSAGAEGITNYIDYDIDSIMRRTNQRPLVTGAIPRLRGLSFGLILASLSIILLIVFGRFYASLFMITGILDNVLVYSYFLKRRTPWSVILGGFSGGFPVLVGWFTISDLFSPIPWFLFTLVVVWIPIHIWSLAYRYKEDYARANIPMLPVVFSDSTTATCISFSAVLLVLFAVLPYFFGVESIYYLISVLSFSVPLIYYSLDFIGNPSKKSSFALFKYSSPYLAVVFILFLLFKTI